MYKNKEKYVAEGIMTFAKALINQHYADTEGVLTYLQKEIKVQLNLLDGQDKTRNWPVRNN